MSSRKIDPEERRIRVLGIAVIVVSAIVILKSCAG